MSDPGSSSSGSSNNGQGAHPYQRNQKTYEQGKAIGYNEGYMRGYQDALKGFLDTATAMHSIRGLRLMTARNNHRITRAAAGQSASAGIYTPTIIHHATKPEPVAATVPNPTTVVETTTTTVHRTAIKRAPTTDRATATHATQVRVPTTTSAATAVQATATGPTTTARAGPATKSATAITPAATVQTTSAIDSATAVPPASAPVPKTKRERSETSNDRESEDRQIISQCIEQYIAAQLPPVRNYFSRHLQGVAASLTTPPLKRRKLSSSYHINWLTALEETGKRHAVTRGMYMAGEVKVNGQLASTKPRDTPCYRCRQVGEPCIVLDLTKEKNLNTKNCSYCMRRGIVCCT